MESKRARLNDGSTQSLGLTAGARLVVRMAGPDLAMAPHRSLHRNERQAFGRLVISSRELGTSDTLYPLRPRPCEFTSRGFRVFGDAHPSPKHPRPHFSGNVHNSTHGNRVHEESEVFCT